MSKVYEKYNSLFLPIWHFIKSWSYIIIKASRAGDALIIAGCILVVIIVLMDFPYPVLPSFLSGKIG